MFSALNAMDLEKYVNSWLIANPTFYIINMSQSCESGRLYITLHYKIEI
ncbi:hypothetical protein FDH01_gp304 [Acinetobacter phage vB_AbaM_ME3]|uniref:Uncharacterized protein n=1 Tax=Acinetobacter phage vB_AbaM_ME3 TaxID=1837876 RepID=A0A172Q0C9_9CAUD|nr:hypothetical protein FDH01_gp304 [Acinetobacter phage vB_AbaM_ME3]AND75318.1 hypothetical protein ME3_157 [Acinetobacter phage vB_AbaM_ME3]